MKRRGSIYVVVLMSTLLVVVMALLGIELAGREVRRASVLRDSVGAQCAAESGLNYAMAVMQQSYWRSIANAGSAVSIGDASVAVGYYDDFGSINSESFDPIRLKVVAQRGEARVLISADAQAAGTALAQYGYVVAAAGNATFSSATVSGTGAIRTEGSSGSAGSTIQQLVVTRGGAFGSGYAGGTSLALLGLSNPDWSGAMASYAAFGRAVSASAVAVNPVSKVAIGPQVTPWGVTNRFGVYVIDCSGGPLVISNSRIRGTLVCVNASAGVTISGSVSWEPAVPGYPILVCDGAVTFSASSAALSEVAYGVNFNPPGTGGGCNLTSGDSFASQINGLVLAKGTVAIGGATQFKGVIVAGGKATISGTPTLTYDAGPATTPPPGFGSPGVMTLLEGSVQRMWE